MSEIRRILGPVVEAQGGGPEGWEERLEEYVQLLRERNEHVNLVSRRSIDRLVESQLLPCLAALLVVSPQETARVLDVGTGGGLPGIPLKILRPAIRLDLVDATRKKTEFLDATVQAMKLEDCCVHWGRIEDPPPGLVSRAPFDIVLARAVGSERRLQKAIQRLTPGAPLWIFDEPTRGERILTHPDLGAVTSLRPAAG